jgi:hypothetical protein
MSNRKKIWLLLLLLLLLCAAAWFLFLLPAGVKEEIVGTVKPPNLLDCTCLKQSLVTTRPSGTV